MVHGDRCRDTYSGTITVSTLYCEQLIWTSALSCICSTLENDFITFTSWTFYGNFHDSPKELSILQQASQLRDKDNPLHTSIRTTAYH